MRRVYVSSRDNELFFLGVGRGNLSMGDTEVKSLFGLGHYYGV